MQSAPLRVVASNDPSRAPKEFPGPPRRGIGLRSRLHRIKALLLTALGVPRGFFTSYPYARHLQPVGEPYPEVEQLLAASPWPAFLDEIRNCRAEMASFGHDRRDPVLGRGMFPVADGVAAYAAIRKFRPREIIEVGSGDSTYFLARAVRENGFGRITCIDPQPRREIIELDVDFKPRLLSNFDAELAASLEPNDILFIDSSHIMLPGMDVDIQLNRLFPRLKPGVIVHVHDIFLPDDYPDYWRVRHYNEQNALIGWLLSGYFDVLWPGRYVLTRHFDAFSTAVGDLGELTGGGSLWLRKA
jgi:hypothetical protein